MHTMHIWQMFYIRNVFDLSGGLIKVNSTLTKKALVPLSATCKLTVRYFTWMQWHSPVQIERFKNCPLTHQVPTGLLRPRIIGNFQRFFKYSKYGPISKNFFLKVLKSTKFSPPAKKAGRMHRQGASADRKLHSGEKNRHRMSRENYYVSW